jgi:hypothetical protein
MQKNVGQIDKIVRIAVGLLLIVLALMGTIGWWGWIGIVPIATGLMGSCPAYSLLGFSTCPLENKPRN